MSRITSRDVRSLISWQRAGHLNDPPVWFRTLADQMDADAEWLKALEAERDRLRTALKPFAEEEECGIGMMVGEHWDEEQCEECKRILAARAALAGTAPTGEPR